MKRTPLLRKTPLRGKSLTNSRPKKKKTGQQTWKNKCDALAGELCRSYGECQAWKYHGVKCSQTLQWCHIKSRRFACIRHDERNCVCMCATHHRFYTDHPDLFCEFVQERDPGVFDYLNSRLQSKEKTDYELVYLRLANIKAQRAA